MIPYRVYRRRSDGVLAYLASSHALGMGTKDIGFIVDAHDLERGDLIEVEQSFLFIDEVLEIESFNEPPTVQYTYMAAYEDHEHMFGDGPWSPQMMSRLRHEARVCEDMSQ